jgi:hypothetical protein
VQVDLLDMSRYSKENDSVKYLLCAICVFTKKAYVRPLYNKFSSSTALAMQSILDEMSPTKVEVISGDMGSEFKKDFAKLLEKRNIKFQKAITSQHHAAVVERFNRTLRSLITKYMYHNDTLRYIDVLQNIVQSYNNTEHSSTHLIPNKITTKNFYEIWENNYLKFAKKADPVIKKSRFNVGDQVRISKLARSAFSKGTSQTFTEEYFTVAQKTLKRPSNIYMYVLRDSQNKIIEGKFYEYELTPVIIDSETKFKIDEILQYKKVAGKQYMLVTWRGYPKEAASWIPKEQ